MAEAILEVRGLTRHFGGLRAVDDVSFDAGAGQITAVIGPNGAGKTTLFNLLTGFLRPQNGSIRFNGRDLAGCAPHIIASFGMVRTFQLVRLFPELTALGNVMAGHHLHSRGGLFDAIVRRSSIRHQEHRITDESNALLEFVGLGGCGDTISTHLTYGQQRLLEISRALAARPKLLLLDEPAAGLNPTESQALAGLIRAICGRGVSILLIEHDMSIVMGTAEKVVVLDFGRKIAEGPPTVVKTDPEVLEAYLGVEAVEAGHV